MLPTCVIYLFLLCPLNLLHALRQSLLYFHAIHISTILWIFVITRIHRNKICNICLLRIWFNSFDMIISSSIQLLAKTTWFHSSLCLNKIPLCLYAMSSLSNPLSVAGMSPHKLAIVDSGQQHGRVSASMTCWLHVCEYTSISVICWLWVLW